MDIPEAKIDKNLSGLSAAGAKEYIAQHIITLKLTEKKRAELGAERDKWVSRVQFARGRGAEDLAAEAEKQVLSLNPQCAQLDAEIQELHAAITAMRRQLPGLGARERSIDPDLLEQELLIAAGYMPGEEDKAAAERSFKNLEKNAAADDALAALKAKFFSFKKDF